jgi:hypothetical protein
MSTSQVLASLAVAGFLVPTPSYAAVDLSLDERVRQLIWEIAMPNPQPRPSEQFDGKQARLLRQLETLGESAVPYIIRYMDDRRPLPFQYIALSNERVVNAFEGMRQYSPKLVVDALAGVLNQVTGESFGYIYSGGTDRARDEEVAGWRKWCANKWPDLKAICDGPR